MLPIELEALLLCCFRRLRTDVNVVVVCSGLAGIVGLHLLAEIVECYQQDTTTWAESKYFWYEPFIESCEPEDEYAGY